MARRPRYLTTLIAVSHALLFTAIVLVPLGIAIARATGRL